MAEATPSQAADEAIDLVVDTTSQPGRTLVRVAGEIDMLTAPKLRETLIHPYTAGAADVAVDLDGVSFLGSTGLGVLVEVSQQAQNAGGRFSLVCSSRQVLRPLSLTGLDQIFDVYDSPEALPAVSA